MKINLHIVRELLVCNKDIAVLINKMAKAGGHLDEPDHVKLADAERKIKFLARTHPEEWTVFQSRDKQTNRIEGLE